MTPLYTPSDEKKVEMRAEKRFFSGAHKGTFGNERDLIRNFGVQFFV